MHGGAACVDGSTPVGATTASFLKVLSPDELQESGFACTGLTGRNMDLPVWLTNRAAS